MLSSITCGDFELNISHPHGMPTLVPSAALESRLDWRLHPISSTNQASDEEAAYSSESSALPKLAVHLHIHYVETLPILLNALDHCRDGLHNTRIWISTTSSAKAEAIEEILERIFHFEPTTTAELRVCPNHGRNFGPLLHHLWPEFKQEELLLHLHGKRSLETDLGDAWLIQLLKQLLPDGQTLKALRQRFNQDPSLGLLMPQTPQLIRPYMNWGNNFELANQLSKPMAGCLHRDAVLMFPAGGMFWVRPAALQPLATCLNTMGSLPPEPLPVDGSSLHAIERLVAHACEASGHHWKLLCEGNNSATTASEPISVLQSRPKDFQQATALIANRLRQIDEQLQCSETNLKQSTQQINELTSAVNQLMSAVGERDEQIMSMANSWGWKLTRLVKRMARGSRK
ncbi:rhamnan synthesis F family protein [Synechococcus sp. UW179A]|uniref:rhamnan synthesis F family protein n=1 Tax=Synechococcus sp. UW179A TaxID=2575510 RepID=UPI0010BF3F20|nr:rhamnan synthesis F family protein [Synechococcus sp. UW179A]